MSLDCPSFGLKVLTDNQDVQVTELSDNTYIVEFDGLYWLLWPLKRSWAKCEKNYCQTGEIHFGSVSSFNNKEIRRLPGIPENHQKRWTLDELKILASSVNANFSVADTCSLLKRSEWSIVSKLAEEYGVTLDHQRGNNSLGSVGLADLMGSKPSKHNEPIGK